MPIIPLLQDGDACYVIITQDQRVSPNVAIWHIFFGHSWNKVIYCKPNPVFWMPNYSNVLAIPIESELVVGNHIKECVEAKMKCSTCIVDTLYIMKRALKIPFGVQNVNARVFITREFNFKVSTAKKTRTYQRGIALPASVDGME